MISRAETARHQSQELRQLVLELAALSSEQRSTFMNSHGLPGSLTNKLEVQQRIQEAVESGTVIREHIINYLDEVVPWGKQHIFLFRGPSASIRNWKNASWVRTHLQQNSPAFAAVFSQQIHIALPEALTPTSVIHETSPHRLRVTMVRKRDWWEPAPEYNDEGETELGEEIEYRAFIHRVIRSFVAFEWDLVANVAMLQISQLPGRIRYENVKSEFANLVSAWLDLNTFTIVDLHRPILNLLDLERGGNGITRAHGYDLQSLQGRTMSIQSSTASLSVFGERSFDTAFDTVKARGTGRTGNLFWLPLHGTPLSDELRVELVGAKNRVNFPSPSNEGVVRHVLADIRRHS